MRRNLLSCGVPAICNYLSIHLVIYPDIASISESLKILTYINGGTAVGSPVIFMELQIRDFFLKKSRVEAKLPKIFNLFILAVLTQAFYYEQNSIYHWTGCFCPYTNKCQKNQNVTESTHCSRFLFLTMLCSASSYCHGNIRLWLLPPSLSHMAWGEPHTGQHGQFPLFYINQSLL